MDSKFKLTLLSIADALVLFTCMFNTYSEAVSNALGSITYCACGIYLLIIVYNLINKPFNIKDKIFPIALILISFISSFYAGDTKFFQLTLMILAFQDVNFEKFIARDTILRTTIFIIRIFLYFYNNSFVIEPFEGERIRYEFGFGHANTIGFMLSMIGIEYLYLFRNKRSYLSYVLCILISILNYKFISSRTSLAILIFALFCFILTKLKINIMKHGFIKLLIENSYLILTVSLLAIIYMYGKGNSLAIKIDELSSLRISYAYGYLKEYGIKLFGQSIAYQETLRSGFEAVWLDAGLLLVLIQNGLFTWIIFGVFFNRTTHYLLKNKKYYEVIIILFFLLYGSQERGLIRFEFFSLAGILSCWLPNSKEENEKLYSFKTCLITELSLILIMFYCIFRVATFSVPSFIEAGNVGMLNRYEILIRYWKSFITFNYSIYDFSIGLGTNIYNILANNFFSPFNIFILLLSNFKLGYAFYLAAKIICLGLFSSLWLSKISKSRQHIIIISLLISLSGVVLSYFGDGFVDIYCLLPLVLYFVEKYVQNNKIIGLIISIILISITNPLYVLISLSLTILYSIIRLIILDKFNFKSISITILVILLSVLSTSFILFPCIKYSVGLDVISISIIQVLKSLFIPVNELNSRNLTLYTSIASLILIPLLLTFKDNKKKNALCILLLVSFIISYFLSNLYGLAAYCILLVCYGYILLEILDNFDVQEINLLFISYVTILVISFLIIIISNNKMELDTSLKTTIISIFVISILALFILKEYNTKTICLLMIFELLLNVTNTFLRLENISNDVKLEDVISTSNDILNNDDSLYRVTNLNKSSDFSNKESESYLDNYQSFDYNNGIKEFNINTISNEELSNYIGLLSAKQTDYYIGYTKNLLSLFNIAGVKYYEYNPQVTDEEISSGITPEIAGRIDNLVQQNSYVLSNGVYYISPSSNNNLVLTAEVKDEEDFTYGSLYLSNLENNTNQMWRVSKDNNGFLTITNLKTGLYIDLPYGDTTNGSSLQQYEYTSGSNQKWIAVKRNGGIEIVSAIDMYKCLDISSNNIIINDYNENTTLLTFTNVSNDQSENIPSYYDRINDSNYYQNKYYVELGYVNNKVINASYLLEQSSYIIESVLREYVAIESSDNTNYQLIDSPNLLVDYTYDSPLVYESENVLNNQTIVIKNGGIPIVNVELYYNDTLVKTKDFYQYNFCNVKIDENEYINRIVINFNDIDQTGYGILLYSMSNDSVIEEELYNNKKQNSFTNINYSSNHITADINISEDNSLVYTYIPYDENWIVTVDGNKVDIIKANYGFIAFRLDSGTYNIDFTYTIPHIGIYRILAILSVLILGSVFVQHFQIKNNRG